MSDIENVKKLREATGAGFKDCNLAIKESGGDIDKAIDILILRSKKINLITSYLCHPSLANNELSGPLVLLGLYKKIKKWKKRNFTYQFLINPETIGSLCFLHSHYEKIKKDFNSGLVLTCLGGPKKRLSYKLSKNGNSSLDKLFIRLNKKNKVLIREFTFSIFELRSKCADCSIE